MPRDNPTIGSADDWLRHAESDLSLAHIERHGAYAVGQSTSPVAAISAA